MSNEREWWPSIWCDESMPPSRPSPDAWLIDADGHWFIGYPFDAEDASHFEKRFYQKRVDTGESVEFWYSDRLDNIQIKVAADGSFEIVGAPPAPEANWFWLCGDDACGDTLADLAKQLAEYGDLDGEPFDIGVCRQGSVPFKLIVVAGEATMLKPHFEQVSQAEAKQ